MILDNTRSGQRPVPGHRPGSVPYPVRVQPVHRDPSSTRPRLRRTLTALLGCMLLLGPVSFATALAGGGSFGFGGGGGGGFGGGGFGGGGFHGGLGYGVAIGTISPGFLAVIALIVLALIATAVFRAAWLAEKVREARKRRAERDREMSNVATDAATLEPAFDPDHVHRGAAELFVEIQHAWSGRDVAQLRTLVGAELMVEWERRLDDFRARGWHNIVEIIEGPTVQYINLTNRGTREKDRVVVFLEATVADYVRIDGSGMIMTHNAGASPQTAVGEYWTLAPAGDGWRLISIEQPAEGEYHLHERPIPRPEDDDGLRDDTFLEMAAATELPPGFTDADLVNVEFAADARSAALDLSLADPRFSEDVLTTSVRQLIAAWAQAVDGPDDALIARATPLAIDQMLYESDTARRTRVVVRGPKVRRVQVAHIDVTHTPPLMRIDAELGGIRYVEDRDTTEVLEGSQTRTSAFTEQFTCQLVDGASTHPWQIVAAAKLPGLLPGARPRRTPPHR